MISWIVPVCLGCNAAALNRKKIIIHEQPDIETTIRDGNIIYKCHKCGITHEKEMDKKGNILI